MDQYQIKKLLDYDPLTGDFTWLQRPRSFFKTEGDYKGWNAKNVGRKSGYIHHTGYRIIRIFKSGYYAHRLAWLWANGAWPEPFIDHINHDKDDNRLANLRVVTKRDNGRNQKVRSNNTSGVMGVTWHKGHQRWAAQVWNGERNLHLGYHETVKDAEQARLEAGKRLGYHANHGT